VHFISRHASGGVTRHGGFDHRLQALIPPGWEMHADGEFIPVIHPRRVNPSVARQSINNSSSPKPEAFQPVAGG
jgi:hypothetical protein